MTAATSIAAYRGTRERAQSLKERVYLLIAQRGMTGMTDDEIQHVLNSDAQSIAPARLGLERDSRVFWNGHTRKTRDDYDAMVWVVAELPHAPRRPEIDSYRGYCPACGRGRRR